MNRIKSRNKKIKVWFGDFPEKSENMDLCVKKEAGSDKETMYYMIYMNTPFDNILAIKFINLFPIEEKERIESALGVRFPKGF